MFDLSDVKVMPMFEGWDAAETVPVLNASLVGLVLDQDLPSLDHMSPQEQQVCSTHV
jgi:hypothetical protein